jgi:glucose/arabinose dehydrogenase
LRRTAALLLVVAALVAAVPAALAHPQRRQAIQFGVIAHGLSFALQVAAPKNAPPHTVYVVRQKGEIDVLVNGKVRATPFANVSSLIGTAGTEQGLLSMAFNPNYAKNHLVYLSYTDRNGNSRVVRFRTNGVKILPGTAKTILFVQQPYPNHNGGQLQFGPDGKLYIGFGDGGSEGDPHDTSQNPATKLGKLIRLDVSNPTARWQTVADGLRNPWRWSFDRKNGDLWIGDVGQDIWEEIDYVPHAAVKPLLNFGWSVYEGNSKYKADEPLGPGTLTKPVYVYHHGDAGCSVTGGYVYRGKDIPSLVGRYVFGDFCSGIIWSGVEGSGGLTDVRQEGKVFQIAGWGEDSAGELYAAGLDGAVYKLAPAPA